MPDMNREDGIVRPRVTEEELRLRRRWVKFLIAGAAVVALAAWLVLRPAAESLRRKPADVAATIFPLYDIARNVAGGAVEVALILPPGASPHTFEPTPRLAAELGTVKAVYMIGHGLDEWASGVVPETADKVVVDRGIAIMSEEDRHRAGTVFRDEEDEHEDEDEHGETDPHYWLAVPNAMLIARNVAGDLIARFPEHEAAFRRNLESYLRELELLDRELRDSLSELRNRKMITLHDAWYYFAVAYRLDVVGTFEPTAGREPSARYLAALTDAVRSSGTRALYSEPQLAAQGLAPFARDNGLAIVEIDPLGGVPGRDTYVKLMKENVRRIVQNQ